MLAVGQTNTRISLGSHALVEVKAVAEQQQLILFDCVSLLYLDKTVELCIRCVGQVETCHKL